ncbi:MAG: hypothetical protein ACXAAK_10620 [Candidatus Thorarchaeota archaeon]|jgi:hypothetical protein
MSSKGCAVEAVVITSGSFPLPLTCDQPDIVEKDAETPYGTSIRPLRPVARSMSTRRQTFPDEYWFSFNSAMKPVLFAKFVTEHFRDAEQISRTVMNSSFSKCVDVLLSYPVKKFKRLGRIKIEDMIKDAGL